MGIFCRYIAIESNKAIGLKHINAVKILLVYIRKVLEEYARYDILY